MRSKGVVVDEIRVLNPGDLNHKVGDVLTRADADKANRDAKAKNIPVAVARFPWGASGRAIR